MFGRNLANRRKRAVQLLSCFFFLPAFGGGPLQGTAAFWRAVAQRNELPQPPQKQPLSQAAALLSCLRAVGGAVQQQPLAVLTAYQRDLWLECPHPRTRGIAEGWPPLAHRRQLEIVAGRERAVSRPKELQGGQRFGKDVERRRIRQLEREELDG